MSPLSRDELSIVLSPEAIALMRTERGLTRRGFAARYRASKVIPCEQEGGAEKPWSRALDTLGTALPSVIARHMTVDIVLSDRFVQYVMVPWFDKLSDAEELALARHRFKELCGSAADSLSVRVSPGTAGTASLASGVDEELLCELGRLMERMRVGIRSIRPHLMVAFNSCRTSLQGRNGWMALLEPKSVCLAVLRAGQISWIRKLRIGEDWKRELPVLLSREAYLADADVETGELLLWAPHLEGDELPTEWPWAIRKLTPDAGPR